MRINPDVIEKYCNVTIGDGGFSFHNNYSEIGMNIYDKNGTERDFFISVQEYLKLEQIYLIDKPPIQGEKKNVYIIIIVYIVLIVEKSFQSKQRVQEI